MIIKVKEFLNVLEKINPAVSKEDNVDRSTHYYLNGTHIVAFNWMMLIVHPFKTDFKCGVPADELYKILTKIKVEDVKVWKEKDKLMLKAGKALAELLTQEHNVELLHDIKYKWNKLPKNFISALDFCSFSASKDVLHMIINCLNVDNDTVSSTDNYRVTEFNMAESINNKFLIPLQVVKELSKFDVKYYSMNDELICFKTKDNVIFHIRRIEGKFPDIKKVLSIKGKKIHFPDDLYDGVSLSSILTEEDLLERKIKVIIKGDKLICEGKKETGKLKYTTKIKNETKKQIEFGINPDFFAKVLEFSRKAIIKDNKIIFIGKNYKHLISLH